MKIPIITREFIDTISELETFCKKWQDHCIDCPIRHCLIACGSSSISKEKLESLCEENLKNEIPHN